MSVRGAGSLYAFSAVLLLSLSAAFGQVPDCTGISAVHNTSPDLINELDTVLVASGLSNPVFVTAAPGDDERLFVIEQTLGRVRIIKNGVLQATPFLSIPSLITTAGSNERGLLGMAFHPDYQNNGYFFMYYTAASPSGSLTVTRFQRSTPDAANPASATVVISIPHTISNHNAGMMAFSPVDGHLYFGTGDGGSACDPGPDPGNAQNINVLLGKMLRLNVDSLPYTTDGNPYDGGTPGADEVWDYGLRNPWRWSFDRVTGAQYIGDVGQNNYEELNCVRPTSTGENNYGWVNYEASHGCPNPSCGTQNPCPPAGYLGPIREYPLGAARSIIGGYVYRGCRMPDLQGTYFYSDYFSAFMKTFRTDAFCGTTAEPDLNRAGDLAPGGGVSISSIASYGEDNHGELYIVDRGGEIFKIVPELFILEVSGLGAADQLIANADGAFEWEDIEATASVDVRTYKIYRSDTYVAGSGPIDFQCESLTLAPLVTWTEPQDPADGQVFYYLVVAQNTDLQETVPGVQSDGTPRVVDTASSCFD